MPELSIITINFNNAAGLEKTIGSVLSQTYRDYEFIVIDGGSTDGSLEVIRKHEARITEWKSEPDRGIYHAQNKGILAARGKYCLFLNSGDFLTAGHVLEKVFSYSPSEDIVYGDMWIDDGTGKPVYGLQPDKITFEFLIHTTLWHPVAFIRRELFMKYGNYDESYRITADYDFFLKTIIVNDVTTKHVPVAVTVFNTAGIGSSAAYNELHMAERKKAQLKYFNPEVINAAERLNALKKSRAVRISAYMDRFPAVKRMFAGFFDVIKRTKK